jgi:hypothetical protein
MIDWKRQKSSKLHAKIELFILQNCKNQTFYFEPYGEVYEYIAHV